MIAGTGFDLTALPRIKALLEKHEARFLARILTEQELAALFTPSAADGSRKAHWALVMCPSAATPTAHIASKRMLVRALISTSLSMPVPLG